MSNDLANAAMWIDAVSDVDAERYRHQLVAAKVALSGTWPFLAAAVDAEDFGNRLALMREQIEDITPPEVLGDVVASLRSDWAVVDEERQSEARAARSVTAATYPGPAPLAYTHVQDKGEYWQVDRIHDPAHIQTLARTASREEAYRHVDQSVPVFENGEYATGGRLHHVASNEEFYDQGTGTWVRLAGGFRVVEGRGDREFPADPDNYEDGIRDAHLHHNAAYDYRAAEGFTVQSSGYQNGYHRTMDALSAQSLYQPDPDLAWRYPHYPPVPAEAGHGGAPTASPIPAGAEVGPDGFPPDYGVGEQRSPEAYARQTTPGPWTVTPGTEWRDSSLPNAATGLPPGQSPSGNPAQASRRTAGESTSDDFNGSDKPFWKCAECGENNHGFGKTCNGCGEQTRKQSARHTAGAVDDHVAKYYQWAKENGHDGDTIKALKAYEQLPGIGRSHTDAIADQLYIGGGESNWRSQRDASRRTAQEGVAPSTHAPNPNYFSQGTNGLQGPPTFPEDPGPEPYSQTPVNDLYGAVPPQLSQGSEQGQQDGQGYSRMGRLVHEGEYQYVHKQGDTYVITQKGTGKVLSHHNTEDEAKAAFRAMMTHKNSVRARPGFTRSAEERTASRTEDIEEGRDHGLAGYELTHFTSRPTAGYIEGHERGTRARDLMSDDERDAHDEMVRYQGGRTAAADEPDDETKGHWQRGFYDARVGRPYAGEEHQDHPHARAYRQGWDEWHQNHGPMPSRQAASGLPVEPEDDDLTSDPDDPYADGRADRRHDLGRMASSEKTWTCRHCGDDQNPEWASECSQCGTCSECGALLPTTADPYETFRLREPHRQMHMHSARTSAKQCPNCNGRGYVHPLNPQLCGVCKGEGKVPRSDKEKARAQEKKQAATTGQIVGHCDHCRKPVRWHDGEGSHLEHLHNSSHKCNDGSTARTSSLPQFFDPTLTATLTRTSSGGLAVAPAGAPPVPVTNAAPVGPAQPVSPNQPPTPSAAGSNAPQQSGNDLSSVSSIFTAYPPQFQHESLQTLTAPTSENPTGRDPDEYKSNTWEGLINQRPMQSAEDRHVNTPVKPGEPLRTRNINTPTPGLDDEDSVRSQDDIDGEEERES